jgi:hypothetical protein
MTWRGGGLKGTEIMVINLCTRQCCRAGAAWMDGAGAVRQGGPGSEFLCSMKIGY